MRKIHVGLCVFLIMLLSSCSRISPCSRILNSERMATLESEEHDYHEDKDMRWEQVLGECIWRSGGIPLDSMVSQIEQDGRFAVEEFGYSFQANGMPVLGSRVDSVSTLTPPVGFVLREQISGNKLQVHLHVMVYYENEFDFTIFDMSDTQNTSSILRDYMAGHETKQKFVVTGLSGLCEYEENKFLPIYSLE